MKKEQQTLKLENDGKTTPDGSQADSPPAAGDPGSGGPEPSEGGSDFMRGVDDDFLKEVEQNDPEYADLKKKVTEKPKKNAENQKKEEPAAGDEKPVDDAGNEVDEPVFDETVIPGLKAEHIKTIPQDALLAVAEYVETARAGTKETEELKAKIAKYESDPIIRARSEMLKAGKQQYTIRDVSAEDLKKIGDELGLDADEVGKLVPVVREILKDRALDIANQNTVDADRKRQAAEAVEKGQKLFATEINALLPADLRLDEKDFAKLIKEGAKHPEWKKAEKGLLKIQQYCVDRDMTYWDLLNPKLPNGKPNPKYMRPDVLYSAAATEYGMPVAMNTSDRDKKMVGDAVQKKLAIFFKGRDGAARTLNVESDTGADEKAGRIHTDSGYDLVKLATDPAYYEAAIEKNPMDEDHLRLISTLRAKGEDVVVKRQRNGAR